jgi:tetratricopeptide (TPR) repeat protein
MIDDSNVGFIVCASCGARMKADREWCLRCEKPLVAARSSELQLPGWVKARGGGTLIFGAVGVVALVLVGFTAWTSRSSDGDTARPAAPPPSTSARTSQAPGAAARPVNMWSATFLDIKRNGRAEPTSEELAAARTGYEQALLKTPDDAETLNNLGLALEQLDQIDDAVARFSRAAQIGAQNWAYHFNLAHALSVTQSWDRAINEYRIAASLFPTDATTQCNLATALQTKGDNAAAIPVFARAIQLAPAEPTCHRSMALSLEQIGRPAEARREYQLYLELSPSAPDADTVKSHLQSLGAGPS